MAPFCDEYILAQISEKKDHFSHFRKFQGDITGRWILALTAMEKGARRPSTRLKNIVEQALRYQKKDGHFGVTDNPSTLNMPLLYGNGWLIYGLSDYAHTFQDNKVKEKVKKLGKFYRKKLPLFLEEKRNHTDFYAVNKDAYTHSIAGQVMLARLTEQKKDLEIIPTAYRATRSYEDSDHSHTFLTIRRGILDYILLTQDRSLLSNLEKEIGLIIQNEVLVSGGIKEEFHNPQNRLDEGCSIFDWLLICLKLWRITANDRYLHLAEVCLRNHVFYNQEYNGGFGSCQIQPQFSTFGKEAPWCCSLFGVRALAEAAQYIITRLDSTLSVNFLENITIKKNKMLLNLSSNPSGHIELKISNNSDFQNVSFRLPFWYSLNEVFANGKKITGSLDHGRLVCPLGKNIHLKILGRWQAWLSQNQGEPRPSVSVHSPRAIFYGPYLLSHFENIQNGKNIKIKLNPQGFIENYKFQKIRGIGIDLDSFQIVLPCDPLREFHNPFSLLSLSDQEIALFPIKDRSAAIPQHVIRPVSLL